MAALTIVRTGGVQTLANASLGSLGNSSQNLAINLQSTNAFKNQAELENT